MNKTYSDCNARYQYNLLISDNLVEISQVDRTYLTTKYINLEDVPDLIKKHFIATLNSNGVFGITPNKYAKIINDYRCEDYKYQYNIVLEFVRQETIVKYTKVDIIFKTIEYINLEDLPIWIQAHFKRTVNRINEMRQYNQHIDQECNKSIDPIAAFLLVSLMENLSETAYCASWMSGTEDILWNSIVVTLKTTWGQYTMSNLELNSLKYLSEKCQGWWFWDDSVNYPCNLKFVDIELWYEMYKH